mgnify:CR=1 FL=1
MQQPGLARLAALAAWVLLGQPLTLPLNTIKGHGSAWLVARAVAKHAHQPRLPLSRICERRGASRFCYPPAHPEQK